MSSARYGKIDPDLRYFTFCMRIISVAVECNTVWVKVTAARFWPSASVSYDIFRYYKAVGVYGCTRRTCCCIACLRSHQECRMWAALALSGMICCTLCTLWMETLNGAVSAVERAVLAGGADAT